MAEWIVCPTCNLRHSARASRTCPRCQQPIDRPGSSQAPSQAAPEPGAPSSAEAAPAPATAAQAGICQICGTVGPTRYVTFRQNIGVVILRFARTVRGNLCSECRGRTFREMTGITFVAGWWGIISFFVTPFILIANVAEYLGARGAEPVPATPLQALPGGLPAAAMPGSRPREGLAIGSLVLSALGLLSCGLLFPAAIAGVVLGVIALGRASRTPATHGGRGLATAGVVIGVLALGIAAVLGLANYVSRTSPGRSDTAQGAGRAFRDADEQIAVYEAKTAFGNTPEAERVAARVSRGCEVLMLLASGGEKAGKRPSLSGGHCLAYADARRDKVCFLVHIPGLRHYSDEARRSLLRILWSLATDVAGDAYGRKDVKVGLGMRGAIFYGAVAVGTAQDKTPGYEAYQSDAYPNRLTEFFEGPPAAALNGAETASPSPTVSPVAGSPAAGSPPVATQPTPSTHAPPLAERPPERR